MSQMILFLCRDTNIKVMNILNDIGKKEDVTEFITTIQLVQITINGLLKSRKEFHFELLKGLQNCLKDYETLLVQMNSTGRLVRMVTNNRLRRKLEQANLLLHQKLQEFRDSIQDDGTGSGSVGGAPAGGAGAAAGGGAGVGGAAADGASAAGSDLDDLETNIELSYLIQDQDGKEVWSRLFGLDSFMVPWDQFIAGMKKILTEIKSEEETVLRTLLDYSNVGSISQHKFSEFLKGFGPVQDCVKNMKAVTSASWFGGFLSRYESDLVLRGAPVGTFLIRLSSSQPGSFALAFSTVQNDEQMACHILINSCKPEGFQIHEQENQAARTFKDLHEIVDFYSVFLTTPFSSTMPFEPWFEGDISGTETTELLTGQPPGTFLVRFSSQVGSYAVSFVTLDGQISHSLIEHEGIENGQFRIWHEGAALLFPSLTEVVNYYGEALLYPYKATGSQLVAQAYQTILGWKDDRKAQMVPITTTVEQIFDITKDAPVVSHAQPPFALPKHDAQTTTEEGTSIAQIQQINAKVDGMVLRLFDEYES